MICYLVPIIVMHFHSFQKQKSLLFAPVLILGVFEYGFIHLYKIARKHVRGKSAVEITIGTQFKVFAFKIMIPDTCTIYSTCEAIVVFCTFDWTGSCWGFFRWSCFAW